MTYTIQKVAVLGAGTMGHGIAQVAALSGYEVTLQDLDRAALDRGVGHIRETTATSVDKGKLSHEARTEAMARLRSTTDLLEAVAEADLVIEAVPERIDLKIRLFQELGQRAPDGAILATNTSSLSVTEIASSASRPERVVGMHFFNPPHVLKLLEIVRAQQTTPEVVEAVRGVGERMGRELIVVSDSPGFATSRLGLVIGLEAMRMLQEGVANAADIDRAMELGYRHPMGPLKLTDLVGLDVRLAIAEHLHRELGEQFRPPQILRRLVRAGKLGRKTGEGFYRWTADGPVPAQ
ncbi:MAG: 3-hydroxybutyryl-CoA dehydrogenase [Myxococcales bacterium]